MDKWNTINGILTDQPPDPDDHPHTPLYSLYHRVLSSAVSRARDKNLMEYIVSVIYIASSRQPLSAIAIADILFPNENGEGRRWTT